MTRKINYTTIPRNGLVGEWLLDGDANATVGTNGTATDITWVSTDRGYQKQAAYFNSDYPSYISLNNITFGNEFSISIIYNWNIKNGAYLYLARNIYDMFTIIFDSTTQMRVIYPTGSGSSGTLYISNPKGNIYQHIIITKSTSNISVYIEGKYITGANVTIPNFLTTLHYLGSSYYNNSQAFRGNIQGIRIYSRVLSQDEITNLYFEGLRKLGPTNAPLSNGFPVYSLGNLEVGKILEISKPKVGSNYINQVDGSSYAATNVTDSTNGKYNVMSFASGGITWSSLSFSTAVCYRNISGKWTFELNPSYITSTGITSGTRDIANINCWNRVLTSNEIEQFKYGSKIV